VYSIVLALTLPLGKYFLINFLYIWVPQGLIFIMLFLIRVRFAVIAGVAIAVTLSLIGYFMWAVHDREGLIWIGYYFILPGVLIAVGLNGFVIKSKSSLLYGKVIIFSTLIAIIGMGIIQFVLCMTVMDCGF
jgi:hypothetical protein